MVQSNVLKLLNVWPFGLNLSLVCVAKKMSPAAGDVVNDGGGRPSSYAPFPVAWES